MSLQWLVAAAMKPSPPRTSGDEPDKTKVNKPWKASAPHERG